MTSDDNHSVEVARVLDFAASRTVRLNTDQIGPVLDEAEAVCLELAPSEELRLEVKRRVAEWKMQLHCDRDAEFETAEALYKNVVDLGYTNLEIEGTMEIYFAQYCERQGKMNEARQILQRLRIKLESAIAKEGPGVYRQIELAERILARIGASGQQ